MAARVVLAAAAAGLLLAAGSAAAPERRELRLRVFLAGVDSPSYVAATRSEPRNVYVVELRGRIIVVTNGKRRRKPFLDLRSKVSLGNERGLFSVAFHPGYARNHRLYVDYTDRNGDTRVVELRSRNAVASTTGRQLLLLDQPNDNHLGGQLQFGPDGRLYVSTGDGGTGPNDPAGGDPRNAGQNLETHFAKLLRIDVDAAQPVVEIAGYGLRNPWRFSFDRATGDLYVADVGQALREEVNYVPRSSDGLENYGWRIFEGTHRLRESEEPVGPGRLVTPIAEYTHDGGRCSVTGGYVYRGTAVPAARGRYFYGDYCTGTIWSLAVVNGVATGMRQEAFRVPNLTSFGEDAKGELYAVSGAGSVSGTVFKLRP
jgi:glucose/arabinose dehydrogenase